MWAPLAPALTNAGYRVIAPDLRGFGDTDMPDDPSAYDIYENIVPDVLAILRELNISKAHVVGHDFGAPVAWALAAQHGHMFSTLTAVSVGHVRAYLKAGWGQYMMSWYILLHQCRGFCEWVYRCNDWALFRGQWSKLGDVEEIIAHLSRPGRLTAGLSWYRVNIPLSRMLNAPAQGAFGEEIVRIPTLGIWSDGEKYLSERQMLLSEEFVDAPWRYHRINDVSHWIPYEAPEALAAEMLAHWRDHG